MPGSFFANRGALAGGEDVLRGVEGIDADDRGMGEML
jgi:hypothetical protein